MKTSNVSFQGTYLLSSSRAASNFLAEKGAKIYGNNKLECSRHGVAIQLSNIPGLDKYINCEDKVLCATKADAGLVRAAQRELNLGNKNALTALVKIVKNALEIK